MVSHAKCMDSDIKIIEFGSRRVTRIPNDLLHLTNLQIFVILKYAGNKWLNLIFSIGDVQWLWLYLNFRWQIVGSFVYIYFTLSWLEWWCTSASLTQAEWTQISNHELLGGFMFAVPKDLKATAFNCFILSSKLYPTCKP